MAGWLACLAADTPGCLAGKQGYKIWARQIGVVLHCPPPEIQISGVRTITMGRTGNMIQACSGKAVREFGFSPDGAGRKPEQMLNRARRISGPDEASCLRRQFEVFWMICGIAGRSCCIAGWLLNLGDLRTARRTRFSSFFDTHMPKV